MKKSIRFMTVLGAVAALSACVSSLVGEQVISRSNGKSEAPAWADLENSGYACVIADDGSIKSGVIKNTGFGSAKEQLFCSLGMFSFPVEDAELNPNLIMEMAEGKARVAIASAIETKVKQNMMSKASGYKVSGADIDSVMAASSGGIVRGCNIAKKYYEVKKTVTNGYRVDYYVLGFINKKQLDDAINMAIGKSRHDSEDMKMLKKDAVNSVFTQSAD